MALSETSIANLALSRIGAKRINDLDSDSTAEAVACRTHYVQVRDALLMGHDWSFAGARAALSEDPEAPAFGYAHQFILPADMIRLREVHDTTYPYAVEGRRLLTDDGTANVIYTRRVTDPAQFDALFAELLVLSLASAIVMPLSQDKTLKAQIDNELAAKVPHAMTADSQQQSGPAIADAATWVDARSVGVE